MADHDPFPRDRVAATIRRMPAYLKLSWRLGRDPLLSRARRMAVVGAAAYLASPVDLVPGVIPVLGQLDDIALALGALRFALAGLDAERRREHLGAVGLEDGMLTDDLGAIWATSAWTVRASGRTTVRVAKGGAKVAGTGVRVVGKATSKAVPIARDAVTKGAPAALNAAPRAGRATRDAVTRPFPRPVTVTKAVPAARGAAAKGLGKVKGLAKRDKPVEIRITNPPLPALGPGTSPAAAPDDDPSPP